MTQHLPVRYDALSVLLHWILGLLFIALMLLGWVMINLSYYNPWYHTAFWIHKSCGLLFLKILLIKLVWVFFRVTPAMIVDLKPWESVAAKCTHWCLFGLMIAMPLSGYGISTAAGDDIEFFKLYHFPNVLPVTWQSAKSLFGGVHKYLGYLAGGLVFMHISAALKHQFLDRNHIFKRMWF